ncbi:MAG: suppressor of fused domain protein, partial [Butyricicoccaceae bacterium]
MVVPPQMEPYHVERAEIAVALPADWKLDSDDEKDYWPLRWLKVLARMPIEQNTWLGYGHTVAGGGPLADNTQFSGVMLGYALDRTTGKPARAKLPGGREVVFYQMLPVYTEELRFKQRHDADALLDLMRGTERFEVVDINRPSYCPGS